MQEYQRFMQAQQQDRGVRVNSEVYEGLTAMYQSLSIIFDVPFTPCFRIVETGYIFCMYSIYLIKDSTYFTSKNKIKNIFFKLVS